MKDACHIGGVEFAGEVISRVAFKSRSVLIIVIMHFEQPVVLMVQDCR